MTLTKTPICDFGEKAEDFKLKSVNDDVVSLKDIKGENGTLIMFICNHCPYVKAIIKDLCHKGYSALLAEEGDDFKEHVGKIPTSIVSEIVGTRGSIIMQIKDKCNVKINISENKQRDALTRVTVAGPSAGVEKTRGKKERKKERNRL